MSTALKLPRRLTTKMDKYLQFDLQVIDERGSTATPAIWRRPPP